MVRYPYNQQTHPPAPFVYVSLREPRTRQQVDQVPALLDTAADRTAIPGQVVTALSLVPLDEITVAGFGGHQAPVITFRVELLIRGETRAVRLEVFGHPEEPYVLLGRDVLNLFKVTLDGPRLLLDIE